MLDGLINVLWFASICGGVFLVLRLFVTQLALRYFGLTCWAILSATGSSLLWFFRFNPEAYLWISTCFYLLQSISVFLLIRTVFSSHLEAYAGIGVFAQKLLSGLVGLSAVISLFAIRQDWLSAASPSEWVFTGMRILYTGFAVFLSSAGIFFARYRVPTRRNVLRLEAGATVYFTIQAFAFLAIILIGDPAKLTSSAVVEAADFLIFVYLGFALTQAGESLPATRHYDAVEEARIEALNQEALRFARQLKSVVRKNSG